MNRLCSDQPERVLMQLVIFKRVGPRENLSRDRVVKRYIGIKTGIGNVLHCEVPTPLVVLSPSLYK